MVKEQSEKPEDLERVFREAIALHHENKLEKACQLYKKILSVMPESPLVNYNLGLALFELKSFKQSYDCYSTALKHAPEEHDLLYNFALCAKRLGKFAEAVDAYTTILESNPDEIDSLYNLGCCLMDLGADDKAISFFLKVLNLTEDHTAALNNIACIHHRNSEYDLAKNSYLKLLKIQPDHKIALHLLASLEGDSSQNPPALYIEELFDSYSSRYDSNMLKDLKYSVPEALRKALNRSMKPQNSFMKALDLGCGTGLGGEAFVDVCSDLVGVDLSTNMIDLASEKNIYSSLYVAEVHDFLNTCEDHFDLIIAADVFIYIGDLLPIFQGLAKISSPNAYLCFSTEKSSTSDYILRKSGRFAHGDNFIKKVCLETGWSIRTAEPAKLREERFKGIEGMLYIAVKNDEPS